MKEAILKRKTTISENFYFLTDDENDEMNQFLLSGKILQGHVYNRNKKIFKYFETESKKVWDLVEMGVIYRKIVLFVRRKRRL
jgi:hypothetical protein